MKNIYRFELLRVITLFIICLTVSPVFAEPTNYTYNYDFWYEQVASPDAYRAGKYLLGTSLGTGHFRDPQGLFIRDNRIYICDSGNNRILKIEIDENSRYVVTAEVSSVIINGEVSPLNYPMDIFENRDGNLYIADTNNNRVLILDNDWNYIHTIEKPDDESIGELMDFIPVKLVVDFANRVFIQARNVNKGLMEFDNRWEFSGYMGANKVTVNPIDYVWKLLSTRAQKERMDLFIPTEYSNVAIDKDGFVYVTNSTGQTEPVRRLNAMGQDILVRNGYEKPVGDLVVGNAGGISGRSRFTDVVAFDNDSYACFDRARGRIFMYDFQGNLLYAFGGIGNREGSFLQPIALDRMGNSLYALDSRAGTLTRFDLTGYGMLINKALDEYKAGRYESSAGVWEDVLKMNGNYDLAYIGIGRAALRQKEYQKAMKFYKLKHYREGYGKAFQLYRKQWVEENLWWILILIGIAIFLPPITKKFPLKKSGNYGSIKYFNNEWWQRLGKTLKYSLYVSTHPLDGFWDLMHEKRGSLAAANVIIGFAVIIEVLRLTLTNFQFITINMEYFNSLTVAMRILLPVGLWTIANWSLTTLMDGKGRMLEIYMSICYALTPYVIINAIMILLSQLITFEEGAVYWVLAGFAAVWTGILILAAMMMVHDYSLVKTILSSLLTVVGMGVMVFIFVIFFSLISDAVSYFILLYKELLFRFI